MALFFDYKLQSPLSETNYLVYEWHSTFPLLAIGSYSRNSTGQVHIHFEEGEHDDAAIIQRVTAPVKILWHPKKKIFLTTWEGGEITSWNDNSKRLESFTGLHQSTVTSLCWSSNGSRLATGDASGYINIWKTDANGRISQPPINSFKIGEKITEIICKATADTMKEREIRELARAAIAGDEAALELFEYKSSSKMNRISKSKLDTKSLFMGSSEALCFVLGDVNGNVMFINENAKLFKYAKMDSPIKSLLYSTDKSMLLVITEDLMLNQLHIKSDIEVQQLMNVKLNGRSTKDTDFVWIGSTLLAYVSGESIIRVLDIEKDENFTLPLQNQLGYANSEMLTCLTYSAAKGIIAAGTDKGNVAMWKYIQQKVNQSDPESSWQLMQAKQLQTIPIKSIKFGTNLNLLCANLGSDAFILSEQKMSSDFRDGLAAVQLGPTIIHLAFFKQHLIKEEKVDMQFKGLATAKNHIVVWSGKQIRVFEMIVNQASDSLDDKILREDKGNFSCSVFNCAIYEQNIYTLEPLKVNVRTFQGTIKQVIQFTENEGDPFISSVNGSFMAVATTQGVVKVYDLSRREAKAIGGSINLKQKLPNFDSIKDLGISCDGYKVTITVLKANNIPDPNLYIWNLEKDTVGYFDFEKGFNDIDEEALSLTNQEDKTAYERSKIEIGREIGGRYPGIHHWEHYDSRLLVCEAYLLPNSSSKTNSKNKKKMLQNQKNVKAFQPTFSIDTNDDFIHSNRGNMDQFNKTAECLVVSLFFNADHGLLVYDSYARGEIYSKLISVRIPYHFFVTKGRMIESDDQRLEYIGYQVPKTDMEAEGANDENAANQEFLFYSEFLAAKIMRDFVGMTKTDNNTTDALLNFSYYLTIGDMDEAFKSIKLIKKESVWENMAQMCVKSHRIDVAKVCLGNMGNVKGIRLLREEANRGADSDTQVALIALNLGMVDEAEKLLILAKRYDLLNKFYQNTEQWSKALDIASKFDKIHLRNTFYNYAKFCEEKHDVVKAIEFYEKSDTHRVEVPRMFLDRDELVNLHRYTEKNRDKKIIQWWGHYFESIGNMNEALNCYKLSEDNLAICRVLCLMDDVKSAKALCDQTDDSPACYHLARHFERKKNFKEAIGYYQRAGAISNAIRICKEHDLKDSLASLAFQGSAQDMLDAARFYEKIPGQEDKAVLLYHKAGHTSKAVNLAFKANKYAELSLITDGLNEKTDPLLVKRVAEFFLENEQFDKAVDMFAATKKVDQAIGLMVKHNVPITEELTEKLTPPKPTNDYEMPSYYSTLELIGDAAFEQRLYTVAAKKYTEANNRTKAMKALMKSGDTSRVIFFANIQKQRETYVMAANYLQSLDWRKDPEIMKNIVYFYTKAKSMESLASFYEACAQIEIDEFQDYEKAMSALAQAYKCITSGSEGSDESIKSEDLLNGLKAKLTVIKRFLDAKNKLSENSEDGLRDLLQLLQLNNLNSAVRIGDVYSLIIEYHATRQRWKQAFAVLQEMREHIPEASLRYYINPNLLVAIHRELNIDYKLPANTNASTFSAAKRQEDNDDMDDIRDNVKYGTYDD